jgi:UTP--glucose-1-phosphate uridylyltransferase
VKGVILAAGYGTRFLPVTKTIPKEMLPLIDRPAIDFVIEEFLLSGIEEILVITSRRKKALEDYLDREIELEAIFEAQDAAAKLEKIRPPKARIFFSRQREMMGTGHALMASRPFVGGEPFVVAYPDDLHIGEPPLARQLILAYEQTGCSVLSTVFDPPELHRYGTIGIAEDGLHVSRLVEKAPPGSEPSREASIGRFLYTEEIFPALEDGWEKHDPARGEYFHTAAVNVLAAQGKVVFKRWEGQWLDTGKPDGFFRSILRYASTVPELKEVLDRFVEENREQW